MILFGRKIIVGWNTDKEFHFGIRREKMGKGGFVAIACWPLLMGWSGRTPMGRRWRKAKPLELANEHLKRELDEERLRYWNEVLSEEDDDHRRRTAEQPGELP